MIYYDTARHLTVPVEHAGQLWLVPRRPGGWAARQRLTLTTEARQERLRPARDIDPGWLGIGSPAGREVRALVQSVTEPADGADHAEAGQSLERYTHGEAA